MSYEIQVPKTIHNHTIERMDGTIINLHEIGVVTKNLEVDGPPINYYAQKIEGGRGSINQGYDIDGRTLVGSYEMLATDYQDYDLLKNEVFKIFSSGEPFYIVRDLEPGKRWEVTGKMDRPKRVALDTGEFEVEFYSHSPFAESLGTTLDPFTFDEAKWQIGQGIPIGLSEADYTTTSEGFTITNFGDVAIDMREPLEDAEITIQTQATSAATALQIDNATTGDSVLIWSDTTNAIFTLKGVNVLQNGVNINHKTNRGVLTLAPGDNLFTVTGYGTSHTTSFKFRTKYW